MTKLSPSLSVHCFESCQCELFFSRVPPMFPNDSLKWFTRTMLNNAGELRMEMPNDKRAAFIYTPDVEISNGMVLNPASPTRRKFVVWIPFLKTVLANIAEGSLSTTTSVGRGWAHENSTLRASATYVGSAKSFWGAGKKFYVVKNANKFSGKTFVNLFCWSSGRKNGNWH